MKKPKLATRAILHALPDEHQHLAAHGIDDDLRAGIEAAIARGIDDATTAANFAIAWRSGFLASLPRDPAPAAPPEADALEAARKEGATAERVRIKAILSLPEAEGREASAKHLAFTTDLSSADAAALLAATPPEASVEALRSLPANVIRASTSPGGLALFDAAAGTLAAVDDAVATGATVARAAVPFVPTPDPFAKVNPNAAAKAAWKQTVSRLNAEQATPEQPARG